MAPNIYTPEIDQTRDELDGFHVARARVGHQAGAQRLGISLWILPPGQAAYPYHFHLAEEEALIVLEGAPTLRTDEGRRTLTRGDVVSFPRGPRGGHQLTNETASEVRLLAISTAGEPDVCIYPDERKVGIRDGDRTSFSHFFRVADEVGYYEGVEPR